MAGLSGRVSLSLCKFHPCGLQAGPAGLGTGLALCFYVCRVLVCLLRLVSSRACLPQFRACSVLLCVLCLSCAWSQAGPACCSAGLALCFFLLPLLQGRCACFVLGVRACLCLYCCVRAYRSGPGAPGPGARVVATRSRRRLNRWPSCVHVEEV
jgi:hypothetical protein